MEVLNTYLIIPLGFIFLGKFLVYRAFPFFYKYFYIKEQNIKFRYGRGSYVVITGASAGIGRQFAIEMAKRRFKLILIGNSGTKNVIKEIEALNISGFEAKHIEADFSKSYENGFFNKIDVELNALEENWSILINNVGSRSAWPEFENMPNKLIKDTIAVGTLPQIHLIQKAIKVFSKRSEDYKKSAIINITTQCTWQTDGLASSPVISVPYLSVYEATNAFGFFQSESVRLELSKRYPMIDYLTVCPGPVITSNTKSILNSAEPFTVSDSYFVKNTLKFLGNINGAHTTVWKHSFSVFVINIFPFIISKIMNNVGREISIKLKRKYYKS